MATFSRIHTATVMAQTGLVPLFYHADPEIGKAVLKACYDGGARVMEFTNRGDFAHEVFAELVKFARKNLPELILGIGSVQDGGTASLYLQLGANFIVTPMLREDIAKVCNRRKVLWLPGCATLNEIAHAEELGAEIVKLFPGEQVGPGFVKAIKGPCPWTSVMPTGGVAPTRESLSAWFGAGVTCVGMGSNLIGPEVLKDQQYELLTQKIRDTLSLIREIRS